MSFVKFGDMEAMAMDDAFNEVEGRDSVWDRYLGGTLLVMYQKMVRGYVEMLLYLANGI
jgi:hypothetical protein